ncbi:MAG: hypothetical protein ACTHM8_00695 [Sphingomonas sp.]
MSVMGASSGRRIQVRDARVDGWTKAKRALFLDAFAATCNAAYAARRCGMNERSVRALKARDPGFARLYEEALQEGYDRLEAELLARTLGAEVVGGGDDENPTEADRQRIETTEFDSAMAFKLLQMRKAQAKAQSDDRRGRIFVTVTQAQTDASLERKLAALERRLAKQKQADDTPDEQ